MIPEASKKTFLFLALLAPITHAFVTTRSTSISYACRRRNNPVFSSFAVRGPRLSLRNHQSLLLVSRDDNDVPVATTVIEYDDFLPRPHPSHNATDVVQLCMDQLLQGKAGAGLEVCFDFSSDRCRVRMNETRNESPLTSVPLSISRRLRAHSFVSLLSLIYRQPWEAHWKSLRNMLPTPCLVI